MICQAGSVILLLIFDISFHVISAVGSDFFLHLQERKIFPLNEDGKDRGAR